MAKLQVAVLQQVDSNLELAHFLLVVETMMAVPSASSWTLYVSLGYGKLLTCQV